MARQELSRDSHSLAAQLPSPRGQFSKKKRPLLWGKRQFGRFLRDDSGEGNCESKLLRDNGESIFAARQLDVSQGPLGTQPFCLLANMAIL